MRDVLAAVACPHSGLKRLKRAGVCVQMEEEINQLNAEESTG